MYGQSDESNTPVEVSELAGVTALAAGGYFTCALAAGGQAQCWGNNQWGQLGDGTVFFRNVPVDVAWLAGAWAITAGGSNACALTSGGGARCWGNNQYGQLGDGKTIISAMPLYVNALTSATRALAVGWEHTCALSTGGGVMCWGDNREGQLGDGTDGVDNERSTPEDVIGLASGVSALAAGWGHTCALMDGGGVKCWGHNEYGQLGDGSDIKATTPVDVIGLSDSGAALAAGWHHTCALAADGGVSCWGRNLEGQLGDGSYESSRTPVGVTGLAGIQAIATGLLHSCALTSAVGVKCWGLNSSGQIGDGTTTHRNLPVDVTGLAEGALAVAAGTEHTCALTVEGSVKCWGNNAYGQLGDGTYASSSTPVDVVGLGNVTALAAGGYHSCALTASGGVRCWGDQYFGELGDGDTGVQTRLADVSGLASGALALASGGHHTCALVAGGRLKCWGANWSGQLGANANLFRLTPVDVVEGRVLYAGYGTGRPGSFVTLTGESFPPRRPVTISVNGSVLADSIQANATGGFVVFLDTSGADPGGYLITAGDSPAASTLFTLVEGAPLRPQEGGGQIVSIPTGIAVQYPFVYLPVAGK